MRTVTYTPLLALLTSLCYAQSIDIPMALTNPAQTSVGYISAADSPYGLLLSPHLSGLTPEMAPGTNGFHVHANPSCAQNGMAAGGHLDPLHSQRHLGPYNPAGHLGDLPALEINPDGSANLPILAPRLHVKDLAGHSLMVHNGADNYTDTPPLGGGGQRMVCGVVPAIE